MKTNHSEASEFIMLGFSTHPELETFLFICFLIIYIMCLTGNLIIFILSTTDSGLSTPMYFFLGLLSFLDIVSTSTIIPKMLSGYIIQSKVISYYGCVAQMFFITWIGGSELLLFTVMAYDRYIAVKNPLRYSSLINHRLCINSAIVISVIGLFNSLTLTYCTFRLPYCNDNKINHFFCEIMPLLKLACADTNINEIVIYTSDFLLGVCCFLFICASYGFILNSIIRIRSTKGKQKAFSSCASHIITVSMYYGAVIFTYIQPRKSSSSEKNKIVSVLYAVITPTLNPIIYSLRNKEVKKAFRRMNLRLLTIVISFKTQLMF